MTAGEQGWDDSRAQGAWRRVNKENACATDWTLVVSQNKKSRNGMSPELTWKEKRMKHRPHQSNQNRIVPAFIEGSTLRIALKCFHTIFATALP